MSISKHAEQRHKIAGKVICDALIVSEFDAWSDVSAVLAVRLTAQERGALAWAVLKGLPDDAVTAIFDTVAPVVERKPVPDHVTEAAIEYRRQLGLASYAGGRA